MKRLLLALFALLPLSITSWAVWQKTSTSIDIPAYLLHSINPNYSLPKTGEDFLTITAWTTFIVFMFLLGIYASKIIPNNASRWDVFKKFGPFILMTVIPMNIFFPLASKHKHVEQLDVESFISFVKSDNYLSTKKFLDERGLSHMVEAKYVLAQIAVKSGVPEAKQIALDFLISKEAFEISDPYGKYLIDSVLQGQSSNKHIKKQLLINKTSFFAFIILTFAFIKTLTTSEGKMTAKKSYLKIFARYLELYQSRAHKIKGPIWGLFY